MTDHDAERIAGALSRTQRYLVAEIIPVDRPLPDAGMDRWWWRSMRILARDGVVERARDPWGWTLTPLGLAVRAILAKDPRVMETQSPPLDEAADRVPRDRYAASRRDELAGLIHLRRCVGVLSARDAERVAVLETFVPMVERWEPRASDAMGQEG